VSRAQIPPDTVRPSLEVAKQYPGSSTVQLPACSSHGTNEPQEATAHSGFSLKGSLGLSEGLSLGSLDGTSLGLADGLQVGQPTSSQSLAAASRQGHNFMQFALHDPSRSPWAIWAALAFSLIMIV
jgi:hypothetical protein